MLEKRRYPRIEKSFSLKLSSSNFDIVTETKNISANGVYCAIDRPIKLMTKLDILIMLSFNINGNDSVKKIHCEGIVVRKEDVFENGKLMYRIGIYFNNIKEKDRKILISYINSHLKPTQQFVSY